MVEENKLGKETQKKKINIGLIFIIIAVLFIAIGCVLLFTKKSDGNSENKESNNTENIENTENKENNNNEKHEFIPDGEIVSIELDSVRDLYNKYHSTDETIEMSGNYIEKNIYSSLEFNVSSLNVSNQNETIPSNYAERIIKSVMKKTKNSTDVNEYTELVFNNLEEEFKSFFGKNVEYDKSLFKCFEFRNSDEGMRLISNCGDTSSTVALFVATKAEKDNSHVYIYEAVELRDELNDEKKKYRYKWTYDLQEDGNYYFLKAERIDEEEDVVIKHSSVVKYDVSSNADSIDDEMKKLYEKYHTFDVYDKEILELKDIITPSNDYSAVIIDNVVERLNTEHSKEKVSNEVIKDLIKEEYLKYFGKNANENIEIREENPVSFGFLGIMYDYGKYKAEPITGFISTLGYKITLTKAEKYNNNIFIYENVVITDENPENPRETVNYSYKWTYELQDDGNYYFVKAERI